MRLPLSSRGLSLDSPLLEETPVDMNWIRLLLVRDLNSFSKELDLFQDEAQIWRTLPGITNTAGTLVLHVCGNLQHFVGAILGGTGYVRNRELEFSCRGVPRADLSAELQKTMQIVEVVLSQLPEQALSAEYPELLGGNKVPTGLFLLHLNTHLALHLGQAGYLRRILSGDGQSSGPTSINALSSPR